MIDKIAVIGHPSHLGGADTELHHQILLWLKMGIEVHICHTQPRDINCIKMGMEEMGCILHQPRHWETLEGMHVISFCNGRFLDNIELIHKFAKTTTFVNCMTWNFPKEIRGQENGYIDFHLYQTDHQQERLQKKLSNGSHPYRPLRVTPYFHNADFPFLSGRPKNEFRFGRISRGDADKYSKYQLQIYESMVSPVPKKGKILGWDRRANKKFGRNPPDYIQTLPECGITQQEFYAFCDVIILSSETFENLPRVGFEAMSSGSVLVVDNRGGWKSFVEDGVTGFLCNDPKEFIYKSSRLAYEAGEREAMRQAAKKKIEKDWGEQKAMGSWEHVFSEWEKLR